MIFPSCHLVDRTKVDQMAPPPYPTAHCVVFPPFSPLHNLISLFRSAPSATFFFLDMRMIPKYI